MKFRIFLLAPLLAAIWVASPAVSGEWTGDINLALGFKVLEIKHWSPIEENGEVGFTFDIRKKSWPVALAFDALWSRGQRFIYSHEVGYNAPRGQGYTSLPPDLHGEVKVDTCEVNAGLRKTWERFDLYRPFIGGGLAWVRADAFLGAGPVSNHNHGAGFGGWVSIGFYIVVDPRFNIALDIRHSEVRIDMQNSRNVGVGGQHFRMLLGYHW